MGQYATTTTLDLVMVGINFSATDMPTLAAKAIEQAEAEVNKYLSKRYDLSSNTFQTSTSIPPLVKQMTERLAEGYLWQWMSRGSKESLTRGKELIDEVKGNLGLIASRQADLLNTTGSIISDLSTASYRIQCTTSNYTDTFAEDDELNWAVDSDKLDDIATNRG